MALQNRKITIQANAILWILELVSYLSVLSWGISFQLVEKPVSYTHLDVYKRQMLNRYVAVKVLKKEYREDENFVKKFRSEAQAAAGLLNPNIVNVYDAVSYTHLCTMHWLLYRR